MHFTRRSIIPTAVVVVLAAAPLLAGCGQQDGSGSGDEAAADGAATDDAATDDGSPAVPDDWALVDDTPSGVTFALPEPSTPSEQEVPSPEGDEVTVRNYVAREDGAEVGFNVLDVPHGEYDLDAGLQSVVASLDGTVEDADPIDLDGHEGMEAEVRFGNGEVAIFQLIVTDHHVLQPLVAGNVDDRDRLDHYFDQLVDSVDADAD